MAEKINQKLVKELIDYHPDTGEIFWRVRDRRHFQNDGEHRYWNKRWAGMPAGYIQHNKILNQKYVVMPVLRTRQRAHRMIWLWVHGELPDDIDHINGCSTDNRILNLRSVDRTTNLRNRARFKNNTSGVTGVVWTRRNNKWRAQIRVNTKQKCLGYHADKFEAICARKSAEIRYGFHPNHGREPINSIQRHG